MLYSFINKTVMLLSKTFDIIILYIIIKGGNSKMMNESIKVYAKLDEKNIVTAVNSSIFLHDVEGWVVIDEWKNGLPRDKFVHAQGSYLEEGLTDHNGHYNYKFEGGSLVVLSDEEKEIFFPAPTPLPTTEERVEALENAMLEMILGGMM